MASPADAIPDLERLMRNVVRMAMEADYGAPWLSTLSSTASRAVERAGAVAKAKRPAEVLRDDWDAVGLDEMAAVLRSKWPPTMAQVWVDDEAARVDLKRLSKFRGKALHAVGGPSGQISDDEIGAVIRRVRVNLEAVRRSLLDDTGEWWPYIASVHSNIPEFCYERSSSARVCFALLIEGDLVTLDAVGVDPKGNDSALLYRMLAPSIPEIGYGSWGPTPSFSFSVPGVPKSHGALYVADHEINDLGPFTERAVSFSFTVRPLRR